MHPKTIFSIVYLAALALSPTHAAEEPQFLTGTQPLLWTGDLSARMVAGIDQHLTREIEQSIEHRADYWRRDFSSREAYERSVAPNRERLRAMIGAVDARLAPRMEMISAAGKPAPEAQSELYSAAVVRWQALEGVYGEGLLLRPRTAPVGLVVAIPDADQTPELVAGLQPGLPTEMQFARRLAENGCLVVVPTMIDRRDLYSGNPRLKRYTNQPHREWIYRQAFEMGRHIIGYEVQKTLAAVDWMESEFKEQGRKKIGVVGHGEGALIAFYSAALDLRIESVLVSGYFNSRQRLWEEPIYRNVFGLLREFGDAEIASLIAPRRLVVEYSEPKRVDGPPPQREGRSGAAPGRIVAPEFVSVESEIRRAEDITSDLKDRPLIEFAHGAEGMSVPAGSERAMVALLGGLNVKVNALRSSTPVPALNVAVDHNEARQQRQVDELVQFTQRLLRESAQAREALVWRHLKGPGDEAWNQVCQSNRAMLWEQVIGRLPSPNQPPNPRSRRILNRPKWSGYEVVVDVWPDVYAWGYLLLPKDLKEGERRPVVVCQHGLEGVPADVLNEEANQGAYQAYQAYAARLAERGFVVYAPHNPYRGGDRFRVLQRKANPLGKSLFSVIIAQHEAVLNWLSEQPFVDPARIGFYGLSYGGKTAMRVPAVLDRYCLSICSADFNEWVQKNVTVDSAYSYLYTGEYEMVEWNLGHTLNYAEMASLIAPRPFMVERGHFDGVAPDTWVAFEYAKVRRMYAVLGLADRTEIEFFNGPHRINGAGTFSFLHRHLNWPEPK